MKSLHLPCTKVTRLEKKERTKRILNCLKQFLNLNHGPPSKIRYIYYSCCIAGRWWWWFLIQFTKQNAWLVLLYLQNCSSIVNCTNDDDGFSILEYVTLESSYHYSLRTICWQCLVLFVSPSSFLSKFWGKQSLWCIEICFF